MLKLLSNHWWSWHSQETPTRNLSLYYTIGISYDYIIDLLELQAILKVRLYDDFDYGTGSCLDLFPIEIPFYNLLVLFKYFAKGSNSCSIHCLLILT